jgi:hypothetical protein
MREIKALTSKWDFWAQPGKAFERINRILRDNGASEEYIRDYSARVKKGALSAVAIPLLVSLGAVGGIFWVTRRVLGEEMDREVGNGKDVVGEDELKMTKRI